MNSTTDSTFEQCVVNGTLWECKQPQCWVVMVQWLARDDWVLLHCGDGPMIAHTDNEGRYLRTHVQVCDWLRRMDAVPFQKP